MGTLTGHRNAVSDPVFSPDGRIIATASWDGSVRLWDGSTGVPLATALEIPVRVHRVAFSPSGAALAAVAADNTIRLVEAAGLRPLAQLEGHKDVVIRVRFSSDGARIVTASKDKTAAIWDAATGRRLGVLKGHTDAVWDAEFSPGDGQRIVTASWDKTARVWDTASLGVIETIGPRPLAVLKASFSPDGHRVLIQDGQGRSVVWDLRERREVLAFPEPTDASISPESQRVLTIRNGVAVVTAIANGKQIAALEGHAGRTVEARFSPDGSRIVTASLDRTACLWDAVKYARVATLSGHPSRVRHAAFSSDSSLVATTDEDGSTRVWEANSGRLLATHRQPTADGVNGVTEVAFAPRDKAIFTRNSQSVQLWEIATGRVLASLEDASERLTDVALSPKGDRLVTAGPGNKAELYAVNPGLTDLLEWLKSRLR